MAEPSLGEEEGRREQEDGVGHRWRRRGKRCGEESRLEREWRCRAAGGRGAGAYGCMKYVRSSTLRWLLA